MKVCGCWVTICYKKRKEKNGFQKTYSLTKNIVFYPPNPFFLAAEADPLVPEILSLAAVADDEFVVPAEVPVVVFDVESAGISRGVNYAHIRFDGLRRVKFP